jgi:hypothetical protein
MARDGMSGNGTGFVWQIMQQEKIVQGTSAHAVEARLIPMQEGELGRGSEGRESGGDAGDLIAGLGGPNALVHQAGLDSPGAAKTPERSGHFFDHAELDAIGGSEFLDVLGEQRFEVPRGFIGKDDAFGQEPVPERVGRRALFACAGLGPA